MTLRKHIQAFQSDMWVAKDIFLKEFENCNRDVWSIWYVKHNSGSLTADTIV